MRLNELHLSAFGRFQGERLELAPGLNIIYGENEAGKSTLQKFLLGMLYGFKKPGGRRDYSADAERYRPWSGSDYRGSLTYTLDSGRVFRVERLFEPGRDMARVFDAATGADLTATFAVDRRKELLFAEAHLGLNEQAFRSTAWAGQLGVGQMDAGRELVTRVANLQESGREDLSVRDALAYLEEQVREIGSERAEKKPYGRVVKALSARRQELERAEALREEMRGWEMALTEARAALQELEAELGAARGRLDAALLAEAEERLQRVSEARRRIRELTATAESLTEYAEVPPDGLHRLRQVLHEAEEAEGAAAAWNQRADELTTQADAGPLAAAMALHGPAALRAADAADAVATACAARQEPLRESVKRLAAAVTEAERELGAAPRSAWVWAAALAAAALAGAAAAYFVSPGAGAAAGAAAGLAVWLWGRQRALRYERVAVRLEGLRSQLSAARVEEGALQQEVEAKRAEAGRLARLALAGGDPAGFRRAYAEWQAGRERAASLERQAADAARRAEAEALRAGRAAASAAALLAEAGVESAADYEAACARREAREKALAEARALEAAVGALLGDATPEALAAEVAELRRKAPVESAKPGASSGYLREEVRQLEARRAELNLRATEIGARLDAALSDAGDPAELRRELEALTEEKAGYDAELAALDLARETIAAVAAELHREFAPRLNQALSAAVAGLTGGKYGTVQVDEQAGMRVLTPDQRTIELDRLSGGTADQFCLGLRVALLDLVTPERLPLLLDDPLVQYDDRRAAEAIRLLSELAGERQVVLMTCHGREVALARAVGAHLLLLTDTPLEA